MTENQRNISEKKTRRWLYILVAFSLIICIFCAIFLKRYYEEEETQTRVRAILEETSPRPNQLDPVKDLRWLEESLFTSKEKEVFLHLLKYDIGAIRRGDNGFGIFSKADLPTTVSVDKLKQDYLINVAAGDETYANKTIILTGKFSSIERRSTNYYAVFLSGHKKFSYLNILMNNNPPPLKFLSGLKEGDEVTLVCEAIPIPDEHNLPLMLVNCVPYDDWIDYTSRQFFRIILEDIGVNEPKALKFASTVVAIASRLPGSSPFSNFKIDKLPVIPENEIKKITARILATATANADDYEKSEFSISFPLGWQEIPKGIIDENEKAYAKLNPESSMVHYDYGFQLKSSENWFEYPYVLIKLVNSGRIPAKELEKLDQVDLQEDIDDYIKKTNLDILDLQIGKLVFDKQNRIIWTRIEGNATETGSVAGLQAMIPTEKGFIQIVGSSLVDDYPTYEPIFRSIALSIMPANELTYRPRWTDNLPSAITTINWEKVSGRAIGKAIIILIIGGVISIISLVTRKKKQPVHKDHGK